MQLDLPITTIAEAKRFFQAMGCSSFHMAREYPEHYDQYRALGISKDTEAEWTVEVITAAIEQLKGGGTDPTELWVIHSRLADLIAGRRFNSFLADVLEASNAIENLLPQKDRLLVAETIVGRQAIRYRSGLIFQSYDSTHTELAKAFSDLARRLAATPFKSVELEARRLKLLSTLAETETVCGVRAC